MSFYVTQFSQKLSILYLLCGLNVLSILQTITQNQRRLVSAFWFTGPPKGRRVFVYATVFLVGVYWSRFQHFVAVRNVDFRIMLVSFSGTTRTAHWPVDEYNELNGDIDSPLSLGSELANNSYRFVVCAKCLKKSCVENVFEYVSANFEYACARSRCKQCKSNVHRTFPSISMSLKIL